MNVPGDVLFSTIRITTHGDDGRASSIGTGFMMRVSFEETKELQLLISNRHVLGPQEQLVLNFHERERDRAAPALGGVVGVHVARDVYPQLYVDHPDPDVDLACVNVSSLMEPKLPLFWKHIRPDMAATFTEQELDVGQEIFFVGYPEGRFDAAHNLPLIRVGHIATVPVVDFSDQPVFIVDAGVFPGSSGSPVFWWHGNTLRFLGVVTESVVGVDPLLTSHGNGNPQDAAIAARRWAGLGVVIKARAVQELVDAVLARVQSGFVPHGKVELDDGGANVIIRAADGGS